MHYLIGLIVAFWLLGLILAFWLLRKLKRRVVRMFRRTSQLRPHPGPEIAAAVRGPKHKTAQYTIFALLTFAVGWVSRALLLPEHRPPAPSGGAAISATQNPGRQPYGSTGSATTTATPNPERRSAEPSGGLTTTATTNPDHRSPKMTDSVTTATTPSPERLSPETTAGLTTTTTRNAEAPQPSEGDCEWVSSFTREDGTYVPGHWSSKPGYAGACPLLDSKPLPPPHEKALTYVGPRGGHYHYSKNGKKVYDGHRQ
jgi:hypothetical protein